MKDHYFRSFNRQTSVIVCSVRMSVLTVYTNQPYAKVPGTVHGVLASLVQKQLDEERQAVFVRVCSDENMTLGGSHNPCVYATLETSVQLKDNKYQYVVKDIQESLADKLQVTKTRTVVRLIPVNPDSSSYNRT